jgi:3-hydroxyacyl-CoA dehydrogenase
MDDATPQDSIIASSSSGLTMSVMQSACKHPERCVIGHPFNPPHVVPLVEVVAGVKTSSQTVEQAIAFYASIGKKPIHVRKEVVGHVANRLQAALYREVVYLIEQGVLDVADSDVAVCWGPGLRWGVMGPNLLFHLGGGQGGIQISWNTSLARYPHGGRILGESLNSAPRLRKRLSREYRTKPATVRLMNSSASGMPCCWNCSPRVRKARRQLRQRCPTE